MLRPPWQESEEATTQPVQRAMKKRWSRIAGGGGDAAGRKKRFTSILYKLRDMPRSCYAPAPSAWAWPSCKHPKTSSFRAREGDAIYRTVNSVYDASSEYFLRRSLEDARSSVADCSKKPLLQEHHLDQGGADDEQLQEKVILAGLRSERLFFESTATSSVLLPEQQRSSNSSSTGAGEVAETPGINESVVMTVESEDPYKDFKASMEEMVVAHKLKDWEGLEELLAWYLKLNSKKTHGVIVGAFVDLLVGMAAAPPSPSPASEESPKAETETSFVAFDEVSCVTFEEVDACN